MRHLRSNGGVTVINAAIEGGSLKVGLIVAPPSTVSPCEIAAGDWRLKVELPDELVNSPVTCSLVEVYLPIISILSI